MIAHRSMERSFQIFGEFHSLAILLVNLIQTASGAVPVSCKIGGKGLPFREELQ